MGFGIEFGEPGKHARRFQAMAKGMLQLADNAAERLVGRLWRDLILSGGSDEVDGTGAGLNGFVIVLLPGPNRQLGKIILQWHENLALRTIQKHQAFSQLLNLRGRGFRVHSRLFCKHGRSFCKVFCLETTAGLQ